MMTLLLLLAAQEWTFDPWESWNAFQEGSSVEFEFESPGMKFTQSKTISKKEEKVITLKTVTKMERGGTVNESPGEEPVRKPEGATAECPLCGKPTKEHADPGKWSEEKVKVGERELACRVWESPAKMCNDNEMPKTKIWYSTEVPGHIVRIEATSITMKLTKFEAKK